MSATWKPRPLNAYPIAPIPPTFSSSLPEGQTRIHGYCPPWCEMTEEHEGVSVEEHGLWCSSTLRGARGARQDGERSEVFAMLTAPYQHGVYRTVDLNRRAGQISEIGLVTVDAQDQQTTTFFSSAEARKLAAALLWAVNAADMLDAPLDRRRRHGE